MTNFRLEYSCGRVRGLAKDVSRLNGVHLICGCNNYQVYAHSLGRAEDIVDPAVVRKSSSWRLAKIRSSALSCT